MFSSPSTSWLKLDGYSFRNALRAPLDGVVRHGHGQLGGAVQGAVGDRLDAPAVGLDVDLALDGVRQAAGAGGHRQRVLADLLDLHPVRQRLDLAGAEVELLRRVADPLEPRRVVKGQLDGLRLVEVVVDDHGHGRLVAARQGDGQVHLDEERLKDLQALRSGAEPPVGGDAADGQPPGGDGVGEVHRQRDAALVVGDQLRVSRAASRGTSRGRGHGAVSEPKAEFPYVIHSVHSNRSSLGCRWHPGCRPKS